MEIAKWNSLFEGNYVNQDLSIYYKDDIFVTVIKLNDAKNCLIQLNKIYLAQGDCELFVTTLPYPAIVYEKHFALGEDETYKYILINTDLEYLESSLINTYIDKKIKYLEKLGDSVSSVVGSYDLKLIPFHLIPKDKKDYFFSDPNVLKLLVNLPIDFGVSPIAPINELVLGYKEKKSVTASLESLRSVLVYNGSLDERLYCLKLVCENFLLSFRNVIVFDKFDYFHTLSHPQTNFTVLKEYGLDISPLGFPLNIVDKYAIKFPLSFIPKEAFVSLFKFSLSSLKIFNQVYTSDVTTFADLICRIKKLPTTDEFTDFEKERIISKLYILDAKYNSFFGKGKVDDLVVQKYKQIGSVTVINVVEDIFYPHYVNYILHEISLKLQTDVLFVFPESKDLFNNFFVGKSLINTIRANQKISYLISSSNDIDFVSEDLCDVKISIVKQNDIVIKFPAKDPLRLLLRPSLTFSGDFVYCPIS